MQIGPTPLGPGLPRPTMLLFNHPMRGIIPTISRPLVNSNNNDEHYEASVKRQRMIRTMILP